MNWSCCVIKMPDQVGHDVLTLDIPVLVKDEIEGREGEFLL